MTNIATNYFEIVVYLVYIATIIMLTIFLINNML